MFDRGAILAVLKSLILRFDVSYDAKKIIVSLMVELDSGLSYETLLKMAKSSI